MAFENMLLSSYGFNKCSHFKDAIESNFGVSMDLPEMDTSNLHSFLSNDIMVIQLSGPEKSVKAAVEHITSLITPEESLTFHIPTRLKCVFKNITWLRLLAKIHDVDIKIQTGVESLLVSGEKHDVRKAVTAMTFLDCSFPNIENIAKPCNLDSFKVDIPGDLLLPPVVKHCYRSVQHLPLRILELLLSWIKEALNYHDVATGDVSVITLEDSLKDESIIILDTPPPPPPEVVDLVTISDEETDNNNIQKATSSKGQNETPKYARKFVDSRNVVCNQVQNGLRNQFQNAGTNQFQNVGTNQFQNAGTNQFQNAGTNQFQNAGTNQFQNAGTYQFPNTRRANGKKQQNFSTSNHWLPDSRAVKKPKRGNKRKRWHSNGTYTEFLKKLQNTSNKNKKAKFQSNETSVASTSRNNPLKDLEESHTESQRKYNFNKPSTSTTAERLTETEDVILINPSQNTFMQGTASQNVPQPAPNPNRVLRPIVIDGSNVARSHGEAEKVFSCKGIELCIDYFLSRGHVDVVAFVPQHRRRRHNPNIKGYDILEKLASLQRVVFTPSRMVKGKSVSSYDDRFIVRLASENGGIIVSNDFFRDIMHEKPEWTTAVEERLLMYCFVGDRFMIPDDPLGKNGPQIDEFLSFPSSSTVP